MRLVVVCELTGSICRLLKPESEAGPEDAGVVVEDGLAVRVSLGTYKIFFEGFECLYRPAGRREGR